MTKYSKVMPADGSQKTDVRFNMSPMNKGKGTPGTKDMGIPPFNQKVKNLHKLSNIATDCKKVKGTDKYS